MTAPPDGALEACLALLEKATFCEVRWGWRDDDDAPGSIFHEPSEGHAYAVAMCPRYGKDDWQRNAEAIVAAVNLLKDHGPALLAALRLREWRPVLTMPKDGGTYLVTNRLGEVCPLLDGVIQNNTGRQDWTWGNPVIAWQPLPAPPTADDLARVLEEGE